MDANSYAAYRDTSATARSIRIDDLDAGVYTLAYGYTCDRDTWHAYVMNDEIHVLVYPYRGAPLSHEHGPSMEADRLRPNKRVYPDTVNETFARLMREAGAELPFIGNFDFTTPDTVRRAGMGVFKGKTHLDFGA